MKLNTKFWLCVALGSVFCFLAASFVLALWIDVAEHYKENFEFSESVSREIPGAVSESSVAITASHGTGYGIAEGAAQQFPGGKAIRAKTKVAGKSVAKPDPTAEMTPLIDGEYTPMHLRKGNK